MLLYSNSLLWLMLLYIFSSSLSCHIFKNLTSDFFFLFFDFFFCSSPFGFTGSEQIAASRFLAEYYLTICNQFIYWFLMPSLLIQSPYCFWLALSVFDEYALKRFNMCWSSYLSLCFWTCLASSSWPSFCISFSSFSLLLLLYLSLLWEKFKLILL